MKGNKKLLIVAILLLLVAVSYTTYAIYRESKTANGTVQAAAWSVKVKKSSENGDGTAMSSANLTFTSADITWAENPGKNGKIAPGARGSISFDVDATGSEVDVILTAALGTVTGLPNGFTVELDETTQDIEYNATEMKGTVTLNITWTGTLEDTTAKDGTDLAVKGTEFTIPVTLTARQGL